MKRKIKRFAGWIVWLVCFIGCIVFASNYGGAAPYMLLKAVIAVPVAGLIYCLIVTTHFKYYQEVSNKIVVKGEPVDYTLYLSNEDHIEYGSVQVIFYKNRTRIIGLSEDAKYVLKKGEHKEIHTSMCCKYRGEYDAGVSHFIIRDYLSLIKITYNPASSFKVVVLPRVTEWNYEKDILGDRSGSSDTKTAVNGDMDVQVRNYVTGDSMRKVHWKASAHTGKLMTREECATINNRVLIVADLEKNKDLNNEDCIEYEDTLIEQAVAAGNTCLMRHIPCTIIMNSGRWNKFDIDNIWQWEEFYKFCGKVSFNASEPVEKANLHIAAINEVRYVVFITGKENFSYKVPLIKTSIICVEGCNTSLHQM